MGDFGGDKEHGGGVFASGDAGAAADALGGVHGFFAVGFGNGKGVCVWGTAGADGNVAAGLDNSIQRRAIHDQVA